MKESIYSQSLKNFDENLLKPSKKFKSQVCRVLFSLLLFIVIYIILMILAIGVSLGLAAGGITLIISFPRLITIMIGIALILSGGMTLFFMIKFIFSRNKIDYSYLREIKKAHHPKLFAFIDKVANETKAPKPKKIFISNEVNAYVFYDSSFWSMFFPVKKNLCIGLGLVNSVNMSEFKSIMGHEFGHFSQRSMKLGSYVYNMNKIIYNMLYENNGFEKGLMTLNSISGYFAITTLITKIMVSIIQWILQQIYSIVNISYSSLSREMEFHADKVAASVSGSNQTGTSLRRITVSDMAFSDMTNQTFTFAQDGYFTENIYTIHSIFMKRLANDFNLSINSNGLINITKEEYSKLFNQSLINIKDQWASHPTIEEREKEALKLSIPVEVDCTSPWILFSNKELVQKEMTKVMLSEYDSLEMKSLDEKEYFIMLNHEKEKRSFPEVYKKFYNYYALKRIDLNTLSKTSKSFTEIYGSNRIQLLIDRNYLYSDEMLLNQIINKEIKIKTFDYKGKKYKAKEAFLVLKEIRKEIDFMEEEADLIQKESLSFFMHLSDDTYEFREKYKTLFSLREIIEEKIEKISEFYLYFNKTMSKEVEIKEAYAIDRKCKDFNLVLCDEIKVFLAKESHFQEQVFTKEQISYLNEYIEKSSFQYFVEPNFNEKEIQYLFYSSNLYEVYLQYELFLLNNDFLKYQLEIKK